MEARQHQQQQLPVDGFTSHITGLSKSQLFDIMSQMKVLIDQNQKQARTILIENPLLTRALFQAQIMLGMVQPPQVMPNVQQQGQSQSSRAGQKSIIHTAQALPAQAGLQCQKSSPQPSVPARQKPLPHVSIAIPSTSVPPLNYQQQQMISPPHLAQQTKGFFGAPPGPPPSQASQIQSIPASPHTHSRYSMHQSHVPLVSSQTQPSLQTPGMFHQPLQPPLPQQPRPHLHPFSHQFSSQMSHSLNFQPSNAPQQLFSQTLFHSGSLPPSSFPQGQPPLPSQPPPQQLYQILWRISEDRRDSDIRRNAGKEGTQGGGPIMSSDYRNHAGTSMQAERAPWMRGLKENPMPSQLPYLPPLSLGQMPSVPVGQPPRLPLLSPEMEKAVLQQVLMLTPEQINLLPPEQRSQVLEIQEILR